MDSNDQIIDTFLSTVSQLPLDDQNEILETVSRKAIKNRERQAQEYEHKAMMLRDATHSLKSRLSFLQHK